MNLPEGKGFFTWQLAKTEGGNMAAIAEIADQAGFGHLLVKISDGIYSYNVTADGIDLAAELVRQAHAKGVEAYGWSYVYLDDPIKEAEKVIQRIRETGVDGLYIDGEGECKGKYDGARAFMGRLRSSYPALPILLCSYRYPSYHPTFPWEEFLEKCDAHAPQVYWVGAHNPVEQLIRSMNELKALKDLPIMPVFSAYQSGSWAPTVDDITRVLDYSKASGFSGCNFWEWAHTRANLAQLWVAIANFAWPLEEPEPPPPPEDEFEKAVLEKLNALIAGETVLHDQLTQVGQTVDYIAATTDAIFEAVKPEMPPDDGDDVDLATYQVTQDKAIAYYISGYNDAPPEKGGPFPMMEQIPTAERTAGQPFKNTTGQTVKVYRKPVNADGPVDFYKIYGTVRKGTGADLFLSAADGILKG